MRVSMILGLMMVSLVLTSLANTGANLGVGDPAPALKVAKWIKGQPVKQFEKGKVYVVEFWATWCGPCRQSIPHLTELAKKYKDKVTFIGVSVWETKPGSKDTSYMTTVASFVKNMGDKMGYNVAVDGVEGTMAKTWMEAAGEDGIPTAFVIGKDGKIAWIGHPMGELDEVLEQVLAGTFDAKAFAAEREKAKAQMEKQMEMFSKIQELVQAGKTKEALAELDRMMADNPEFATQLAFVKYNLLLREDEPAAHTYARQLSEGVFKDNAMALNSIAWSIVDDSMKLKSPDYDLALTLAQRAAELSKYENAYILDTLAYTHFKKGNLDAAIEFQEKAVKMLDKMKDVPEETRKEITDRLEMFKKKKNG